MPVIEMYSGRFCPYCSGAKRLLRAKAVEFTEIDVDAHPQRRTEMIERAGGRYTVPQIFIDGRCIGGYDDLAALDDSGELDALLTPESTS